MLGRRFYAENGGNIANNYNAIENYIQGDWRNVQRSKYAPNNWLNAALAGIDDGHNGGGPIWAIFDSDAVTREGWQPQPPQVDIAAGFFFSANRLADLARKIVMKYQRVPMPPANLEETVVRYNSFVESGVDADFDKPTPGHRIEKPPFYAAWATPVVHDARAGLRINPVCQVIDMNGDSRPLLRRRRPAASASTARPRRLPGLHRRPSRRRAAARTGYPDRPDISPSSGAGRVSAVR
jgi:hypothetical protein